MYSKPIFLFFTLMGIASACLGYSPRSDDRPCGVEESQTGEVTVFGAGHKISKDFQQGSICGFMPINSKPTFNISYKIYPSFGDAYHSPTMIFINGGPGMANYLASEAFSDLLLLRLRYNLVFYDQRGTGRSYLSAKESIDCHIVNTQKNIDDLRELIQRVSPNEPVELFSHSYGVEIALRFASQNPLSVSKIIATSSSGDLGFMRDQILDGQPITSLWDEASKQYSRWEARDNSMDRQNTLKDKQEALSILWPVLKTIESKNISVYYNGKKEKLLEPMLYTALKSEAENSAFGADTLKSADRGVQNTLDDISNSIAPGSVSILVNNTIVCGEFLPALTNTDAGNANFKKSNQACRELRPALCKTQFPAINLSAIRAKVYFVYGDQDQNTKKLSIDQLVGVNPSLFVSARVSGTHDINLRMLKAAQQQQPDLFSLDLARSSESYLH